ncbi:hypothetical protein M422DRAFT_68578 [Sphaerobolus stellatus SS14]|uniref:Uncharacterized protein n=1 Tax=Sphaerobolus stellatus (strain SS14) TaxID=990650 RepID=A0A0C9VFQ8_SPHS4|nr:hypothetical protein M422DRAFT_68578 [Sphaerobolus stellatus SS14]
MAFVDTLSSSNANTCIKAVNLKTSTHNTTMEKATMFGTLYRLFQRDSESDILTLTSTRPSSPIPRKKSKERKTPQESIFSSPPISSRQISYSESEFSYPYYSSSKRNLDPGSSMSLELRSVPLNISSTAPQYSRRSPVQSPKSSMNGSPYSSASTLTDSETLSEPGSPTTNTRLGLPPAHRCLATAISKGIKVRDFALEEIEAERAATEKAEAAKPPRPIQELKAIYKKHRALNRFIQPFILRQLEIRAPEWFSWAQNKPADYFRKHWFNPSAYKDEPPSPVDEVFPMPNWEISGARHRNESD